MGDGSGSARGSGGLCIGLDVGTSGVKAVLASPDGRVLADAIADYPLLTPKPGWTEQEPETWWAASCRVLSDLASKAPGPIEAIGLTGQMHGAVFLDADGEVIRPALLWNDQRTAAACDEIEERVGSRRLREITGNPALTGFQAPKILWLRENEPEAYARVSKVLLPKDFVRFRLTGDLATDASDAAGTLLLDLAGRDWSPEVLEALDIPKNWLPAVHEGPDITGHVSADGARATGLSAGLPVVAGGGDNAAAAVGSGVVADGSGFVSLGTSGVVFVATDRATLDPEGRLHAFCHAVPGRYHLMGVVLAAGGSLRWYRDNLARLTADEGDDAYGEIFSRAAEVAPGADDLFYLPYLAGERTPHMDPFARGAFAGLTLAHDNRHMARALIEGVSFALKDSLDLIQALGISPHVLQVVGGGARSPIWRRWLAAILGADLQRLEVEEGPAMGAALLAAVGAGFFDDVDQAVAAAVRPNGPAERSDPELTERYRGIHRRFSQLYPALKASCVWHPPPDRRPSA
ncbi:MAG: xylulokinase [Geminicoccaceae bacterium]